MYTVGIYAELRLRLLLTDKRLMQTVVRTQPLVACILRLISRTNGLWYANRFYWSFEGLWPERRGWNIIIRERERERNNRNVVYTPHILY